MTGEYEKFIGSIFASRFKIEELKEEDDIGYLLKAEDQFTNSTSFVRIWKNLSIDDKLLGELREYLVRTLQIRNPGIMNIEAIGKTSKGDLYYVIPSFSGESFRQKLISKKLTPIEAVSIIASIAEVLFSLHNNGIIHGSLHPGAILIPPASSTEPIKIIDLGLSFLMEKLSTQVELLISGAIVATTPYRSPEQLNHQQFDHRSDIYSLGAILFETLVGKPPYYNMSPLEILAAQLKNEVPQLSNYDNRFQPDSPLQKVLNRALAVKPGDRYPDIRQFGSALKSIPTEYLSSLTISGKTQPVVTPKKVPPQKGQSKVTFIPLPERKERRLLRTFFVILMIGIVLGGIFYYMFKPGETDYKQLSINITKRGLNTTSKNLPINYQEKKSWRESKAPQTIKLDPEVIERLREAEEALNSGNNKEAVRLYKAVLNRDSNNIVAIRNIGIAYANMGNKSMAVKYLRKYLQLNPNPPDFARIHSLIEQLEGK